MSGSKRLRDLHEGARLLAALKGRRNRHRAQTRQDAVTGNGISKLVFTIPSAVAKAERDRIRERIRDIKADQRQRGRYLGGIVPFGWRVMLSDGGDIASAMEQGGWRSADVLLGYAHDISERRRAHVARMASKQRDTGAPITRRRGSE